MTARTIAPSPNLSGVCGCGCGQTTPIARDSDKRRGHVCGEHTPYCQGHGTRKQVEYTVDPETGCWIWAKRIAPDGYGHAAINRKFVLAHRMMWERVNGPVPEGLELDHLCRNRACVNPEHLEAVTHSENVIRGNEARRLLREYGGGE